MKTKVSIERIRVEDNRIIADLTAATNIPGDIACPYELECTFKKEGEGFISAFVDQTDVLNENKDVRYDNKEKREVFYQLLLKCGSFINQELPTLSCSR
jgi:hypothetical protein